MSFGFGHFGPEHFRGPQIFWLRTSYSLCKWPYNWGPPFSDKPQLLWQVIIATLHDWCHHVPSHRMSESLQAGQVVKSTFLTYGVSSYQGIHCTWWQNGNGKPSWKCLTPTSWSFYRRLKVQNFNSNFSKNSVGDHMVPPKKMPSFGSPFKGPP